MLSQFRLRAPRVPIAILLVAFLSSTIAFAQSQPVRARLGMVVSQNGMASAVGRDVLKDGGNAIDAAVATAFALAVVHPTAGNIGGGGLILFRPATGQPLAYDFREMAPAKASPTMFLKDGKYDPNLHHNSHLSVGVPGTVPVGVPGRALVLFCVTLPAASTVPSQ